MAARESFPRRGHWSPIQPCRDGVPSRERAWAPTRRNGGASVPGLCSGETSKEASVQVGQTMAGTWVAEWRGRPAQHPFHPLLQPRGQGGGASEDATCARSFLCRLQRPHSTLCRSHGACVTGQTSGGGAGPGAAPDLQSRPTLR